MITGDYHHTAVAVAKTVGMVKPDSQVVVIDMLHQEAAQPLPLASQTETGNELTLLSSSPQAQTPVTAQNPQAPGVPAGWQSLFTATLQVDTSNGAQSSGTNLSFQIPALMQMSASLEPKSNKVPSMRTTPPSSLPSGAALSDKQPSEAALPDSPCIEVDLPVRQPVEATWLSRLPSHVLASKASSLPGSANDNTAIVGPSPTFAHPLPHLSHKLVTASGPISHDATQKGQPLPQPTISQYPLRGLTFTRAGARYHMDPYEAFTAMSEGFMQCAVTGHAFEYLLQLADVPLLEVVLQSAVVFSRMQVCKETARFYTAF